MVIFRYTFKHLYKEFIRRKNFRINENLNFISSENGRRAERWISQKYMKFRQEHRKVPHYIISRAIDNRENSY